MLRSDPTCELDQANLLGHSRVEFVKEVLWTIDEVK